jgi:class 3 adenylate cyclase
MPVIGESIDATVDHTEEVVTGRSGRAVRDREYVAVLFTDIVDSTAHLVAAGDQRWREILDTHDRRAHQRVRDHHGRVVKSTGDGVLAAFPSADDALAAARGIAQALAPLSLRIRAAIHVGEVELRSDGDIGGLNVHVAARLLPMAGTGNIVLSEAAAEAVAEETAYVGDAELKGLPGLWPVHIANDP